MMGANVTEMLAEPTLAKALGATAHQIVATVHPHPTMSEAVMEAAEAPSVMRYTCNRAFTGKPPRQQSVDSEKGRPWGLPFSLR